MGRVHLVRDTHAPSVPDDAEVEEGGIALKVLERFTLRERFVQEFELLRRLSSPAFVRAWDLAIDRGSQDAYMTMEEVRGEPLKPGSVSERARLLELSAALLRAVDHLHRLGMVHGDLSPPNVLAATGPGAAIKILDLGAGGESGSGGGATSGVLAYAAPERLEGRRLTPRSDLWSVGALVFGLIHSCHPFPDYPRQSQLEGGPERDGLGADPLDPWLDRLLAADPEDRFPTAAAALAALEALLESPLPLTPADEVSARLTRMPFVDVGRHLSLLVNRIRTAGDAARPQVLQLQGPAGSGRTRLLQELGHALAGHGLRVAYTRVLPSDAPGAALDRLLAQLGEAAAAAASVEGPMARARALLAHARAATAPVVLITDDLDQADEGTQRAFSFIARTAQQFPDRAGRVLLVTATAAPAESPDVRLEPWRTDDVEELLTALFPGRRVGARVAQPICEAASGVPAVLELVLSSLAASGALQVNPAAVTLASNMDGGALGASTFSAALRVHLESLDADSRTEAAMLAHARGPVPARLMRSGAHALLASGLAVPVQSAEGTLVALRAPSTSEAAAELMDAAAAHAQWEARWSGDTAGGETARAEALWYALESGRDGAVEAARAALAGLPAAAGALLVTSLVDETWPGSGDGSQIAAEAAEAAGRLDVAGMLYRRAGTANAATRLGTLEARQARHPNAIEAFEEALRLGGDMEPTLRAEVLAGLARSAALTGRQDDAARWAEEGLELVGDGDGRLRGGLRYTAGLVAWYRGDNDDAHRLLMLALADVRAAGDRVEEGAVVTALGLVAHRRRELDAAVERYQEALVIGETAGDDARVLTSLQNLGVVHHQRGAFTEALATYAEALELAEALDQTGRVIQLAANLGNLWRYLGDPGKARVVLQRGLELARRERNRYMETLCLTIMGEVACDEEAWAQGERLLTDAVTAAVETRSAQEEAESRLALTRLHLETRDFATARRAGSDALAAARKANDEGLETQALTLLAAAHGHSVNGDDDEATRLIALAISRLETLTNPDNRWPVRLEAMHEARRRANAEEALGHAREVERLLQQLVDAVPARHQAHFRAQRGRWQAWLAARAVLAGVEAGGGDADDERWTRLLEVARRLSSEHNVQRLLEYIMDSAIVLSGAERGFLLLSNAGGGDGMTVGIARNLDGENIRKTKLKISHSIAQRVLETGEPALTVDAMEDERYRDHLSVHDLRLRSVLCLPMTMRGKVLGAIYLDNRFRASAFAQDDVALLEAFVDQAAIALATARLLEDMGQTQKELEASRGEIESLNEQLKSQLAQRTQELEDTHRVVIRQRQQLEARHQYDRIIGESDAIRAVFRVMDRLLDNNIPVLIEGESGTGKELVARAIHFNGDRKDKPFVAVNCGAIPANLLESELFGHVRGAFTGATSDKKGLFEAAHRGTLLLDELGELPLEMQVKLLRVLQSGEIKKVGSTREDKVDVRIIAATNRRLEEEVAGGRFREDLYYRLAVIPIRLPPLRERRGDVALLTRHFLVDNREAGIGNVSGISRDALALLSRYGWPGNVRQLEMVLKNASLFADSDTLEPEDFHSFPEISGVDRASPSGSHLSGRSLADIEREAIIQALHDTRGNKKRSAEQLGIDRRTLYNKLAAYKIVVEKELRVS